MTGKIDKQVLEKFKIFQEHEKGEAYRDLDLESVEFEKCFPFDDDENIVLSGSKSVASHDELKNINDNGGVPVYDASANINTYADPIKYKSSLFEVKDNSNPDISFASEGNSSAGTNFIIHQNKYFANNHRTVMQFLSKKYYSIYVYWNIFDMKKKYGFKRGYTPSQKELKKLKIMIPIPKPQGSYTSYDIQKAIVEFLEFWKVEFTEVYRNKIAKIRPILETMKKNLVASTFKLDSKIVESFNEFAKDKGFDVKLEDIDFVEKSIYKNANDKMVDLLNSKRIPITKKDRKKGPYPYYGASGISDYVDNYIFDDRLVLLGEDGAKWSANENSAFIAEGKFWVNNHAHIMKPIENVLKDTYLVFILNMMDLDKYVTNSTPRKLSQTGLKTILIHMPTHENHNSIDLQNLLVSYWEMVLGNFEKREKLFDRALELCDKLDEAFLYRTFSKIEWSK